MTTGTLLLILAVCVVSASIYAAEAPRTSSVADVQKAARQFREFHLGVEGNIRLNSTNEHTPDPSVALEDANSLRADGTWSDIDYASRANSGWPPALHCTRLIAIISSACAPDADPKDRAILLSAFHRALGFWAQHDLQCPNWWYNQIGIPRMLGTAALLAGDEMTGGELTYITGTVLPRGKTAMTGQNRVWLAGITAMQGMLTGNEALLREASAAIWEEVHVTEQEGIQPDFSFHQHGPQQQFGNYGMAFAVEICRWGTILRRTPWAMHAEGLEAFRGYLLEGQNWVCWRGSMDISACGRQLQPKSPRKKAGTLAQVMRNAAILDPGHANAYLAFVRRLEPNAANDLLGNHCFWRSDYVVQRWPDACATLKMSSRRVIGTESMNEENLLGYYLADGALYLYRRGDEYEDIAPVWDWRMLPGVTCPQSDDLPWLPAGANFTSDRQFVGGVSDGTHGCAAMDYQRDGLAGHKAWFFGQDVIVCLGADIHSTREMRIATTINQCLLRGPVLIKTGGKETTLAVGEHSMAGVEWVEHDGWRYAFPAAASVAIRASNQTGNWSRVFRNPQTPTDVIQRDVFTLWLDHGTKPAAASYAYAISPAQQELKARVIANSAAIQAVALDDQRIAVVFWKAGKVQAVAESDIEADQPCALLLDARARRLVVADPSHTLKSLNITLDRVRQIVELPQGGEAGRSAVVLLK